MMIVIIFKDTTRKGEKANNNDPAFMICHYFLTEHVVVLHVGTLSEKRKSSRESKI